MQKYCWSVRGFIWKYMLKDFILRLKDGRLVFNRRVILKDISHIKSRINSTATNKTWIPKCPLGKQLSHFFFLPRPTSCLSYMLLIMLQDDLPGLFPIPGKWALKITCPGLTGQNLFFECWWKVNTEEPPPKNHPHYPDLSLSIVTKLKILKQS